MSLAYSDTASKASIFSLLNPAPLQKPLEHSDKPTSTPDFDDDERTSISTSYEYSRYKHRGRTTTRGIRKSYRKSPYPHDSAVFRRSSAAREGRLHRLTKRAQVSLDEYLNEADLEKEARKCRAEWLKDEANRVEPPRPASHSQSEIRALARWLADYSYNTLSNGRPDFGKQILLKELRAEIQSLLSSCINPPGSILFLALLYLKKLFPFHLDLYGYSHLDCAKVIFRGFCIALMFSFKWLDDLTHSIASTIPHSDVEFWRRKRANPRKYRTCWSDFLSMSVDQVKDTERAALSMLDWNISVSTSDWFFWLESLHVHTLLHSNEAGYMTVLELISRAQYELRVKSSAESSPASPFGSPSWGQPSASLARLRPLERALLIGIPIDPLSVHPVVPLDKTSEWTPPMYTAELRCSEDEIVHRPTKVIGCAPGQLLTWPPPLKTENCPSPKWNIPSWTQDMRAHRNQSSSSVYIALEDHNAALTPIFLRPSWRVYDYKTLDSSVFF